MYFVNSSEWSIVSRTCIQESVRSLSAYNRDLNRYKVWIKVTGGLFVPITIASLVVWVISGMNPDIMVLPVITLVTLLTLLYVHISISAKQYTRYLDFERGYDSVMIDVPRILLRCAEKFYHTHQPHDYVRHLAQMHSCERGEVDHIEAEESGFHRRWLEEFPQIFQRYLMSASQLSNRIDGIEGQLRDRCMDDLYRISVPVFVQIDWLHARAIEYDESDEGVSKIQKNIDFNHSVQRVGSALKDLRTNIAVMNSHLDKYT